MSPRLAFAIDAAYRAGRATLAHFNTGVPVDTKADNTPVTLADREAERLIRSLIGQAYPNENILGEEEGGSDSPDRWVIDPIDGTKSFVSGVPLYSTLLSYEQDGEPIVGVAYFPALDELIYAEKGQGTIWNGRPCQVSKKTTIKGSVICGGGHGNMVKHGRAEGFLKIAELAMATRTWSDAYGHLLVATGRTEGMIEPVVSRWDISPMILIVREAGGTCTTFSGGDPLQPTHASGEYELVASNGLVHAELLNAFQ